jgi:hypothetical protein
MHQKTKDKPIEKEDRTFRNHFENTSEAEVGAVTISGLVKTLDRSVALASKGFVATKDPTHPIIRLHIDLDTKAVTSVEKKFEFAKGAPTYELVISGNAGTTNTTYSQETQKATGTTLSDADVTILAGLMTPIINNYVASSNEILKTREQDGLQLRDQKCEHVFEAPRNLSSTHRAFIKEVTIPMYQKMRSSYHVSTIGNESLDKNVWSVKGAVFASTQAAMEGGYGSEAAFKKAKNNGNFWGIGGVKNFVNTGAKTSEDAFDYWYDYLSKGFKKKKDNKEYRDGPGWGEAVKLFETGDFTTDQMNKALRSGRHKGSYPYNNDPNSDETYYSDPQQKTKSAYLNYAGKIIDDDMMKPFVLRFAAVLQEEISALASDQSKEAKYKSDLYEAMRCELGEFLQNDYPALLKTKDEYK